MDSDIPEAPNWGLVKENEELAKQVAWFRDAVSILGFDCPPGDGINPLKEQLKQLVALRQAVDDACMTSYLAPNWDKPRTTLHNLIDWNVKIALDPAVSREAAELAARGTGQMFHDMMHQQRIMLGYIEEAEKNEQELAETDNETVEFKPMFYELEQIPEGLD